MATGKPHKLSEAERTVLTNLAEGKRWDSHIVWMRNHGRALIAFRMLRRLGYRQDGQITEAGRLALRATEPTKS